MRVTETTEKLRSHNLFTTQSFSLERATAHRPFMFEISNVQCSERVFVFLENLKFM